MDGPRDYIKFSKSDRERQIPYDITYMWNLKQSDREFPCGPVVRTQCFHCQDLGLIPDEGTKIP